MLQYYIYIFKKIQYFHLRQGEAGKDKFVPGKTPSSVILRGVRLQAV